MGRHIHKASTRNRLQDSNTFLQFSLVQLLSHVQLFATPWTVACQFPLSFTNSRSLLKFMSTESMVLSNHLICYHPFRLLPSIFPRIWVFSKESVLHIRWTDSSQSTGASASAWVFAMNIHGWFPLGLTGLISLKSKGLSRVFSTTTFQKHQFFSSQSSLRSSSHILTWLQEKP